MSSSKKLIQAAAGVGGGDFYPYTVDYSARFNDNDSPYLSRSVTSSGSQTTWTFSCWVKRSGLDTNQALFNAGTTTADNSGLLFNSSNQLQFRHEADSTVKINCNTDAVFRDTAAWMHIVVAYDSTEGTQADRLKIWVNGESIAVTQSTTIGASENTYFNGTTTHKVGGNWAQTGTAYVDGYLAQTAWTVGTAYEATDFGQSKNGVWVPKNVSGLTFGTNGFLLDFSNSAALGTDVSGNGNNFTSSGLTSSDQMPDTPTSNWATLNPLQRLRSQPVTYAEGNLYVQYDGSDNTGEVALSTIRLPDTGKWYFEGIKTGGTYYSFGVNTEIYSDTKDAISWGNTSTGRVGVMVDCDTNTMYGYVNGTLTTTTSITSEHRYFKAQVWSLSGSGRGQVVVNFGQNGTFNGTTTAQGNTDANGLGDFYYAPPAGALALCTANLPEPVIGPNSVTTSDENFDAVLYAGNSSTQSISTLEFQPDLVWIKTTNAASTHVIHDAVRGNGGSGDYLYLRSDELNAESQQTDGDGLLSLDSNGFTLGYNNATAWNSSGTTYVAWNWKANGSGVSNTDGTTTSTVSANTNAGFSIVTYTGTGVAATVGHGLGVSPSMIILKERTSTSGWFVYTSVTGAGKYLLLNDSIAATANTSVWNNTAPTSSVFSVGANNGSNENTQDYVAYCFAEVEGFSKVGGSYTGNGSADGPFVYTGFRPAFIITKRTDTSGYWWELVDTAREPYNPSDQTLYANVSDAEYTSSTYNKDLLSNGFKIRGTNGGHNASGGTYIYMAFAEMPFKYSVGR